MSGKQYLFDTNIIVDLFIGNEKTKEQIKKVKNTVVSVVTLGELYFGAENSQYRERHLKQVAEFVEICSVIDILTETTRVYGKIKSKLKKKGTPIPENDIWIAASAIQHNLILITKDRHFNLVDGIKLELIE